MADVGCQRYKHISLIYKVMHVFELSFYVTVTIYTLLYHPTAALIFIGFVAIYALIAAFWPSLQSLSVRRKFALSIWQPPAEGIIYNNLSLRVDPLLKFLSTIPREHRPTITHYVIKACGEVLKENPELNGKLIFGKFLPYKSCDVSCLVNIDDGNDVGMMLVKDVPSKSVIQIAQEIKKRSEKIRPKGGDDIHKQRMGLLKILPTFLVAIVYKVSIFLTSHLNLDIPSMGITKDALGSMIVTSVGSFGYIDACTSFFGTTGQWVLLTVNAAHEQVIAVNGKPEVANIVNVNCVIDHRYLYSGGKGKDLISTFKKIFEAPEKYLGEVSTIENKKEQ